MREAKLEFAGTVYSIYLGIHQNENIDEYETRLDKEANSVLDELVTALNNIYSGLDEKLKLNKITYEDYEKKVEKLKDEVDSKFGQLIQDCIKECDEEGAKLNAKTADKDFEKFTQTER